MAEEYADAGIWPANGMLFRIVKRAERNLVAKADGIVVLTYRARNLLRDWYCQEIAGKYLQVIPCCVDLRMKRGADAAGDEALVHDDAPTISYVGKLGGWYLTEQMVAFVAEAIDVIPGLRWQVWTQSDPEPLRRLVEIHGLAQRTRIGSVSPEALASELVNVKAGISLIKPCVSKFASSPTKIAEYLAAGLPVVSTSGIGDTDSILSYGTTDDSERNRGSAVGVLVEGLTDEDYRRAASELQRLLADPETPRRCREVASNLFDLEQVGWVRYREVYERLIGRPDVGQTAGLSGDHPEASTTGDVFSRTAGA